MNLPHKPITSIQNIKLSFLQDTVYNNLSIEEALCKKLADLKKVQNELIIWNKQTRNLIGDTHRVSILEQSGCTEIQCAIIDLNKRQENALNSALIKMNCNPNIALLFELIYYIDKSGFSISLKQPYERMSE